MKSSKSFNLDTVPYEIAESIATGMINSGNYLTFDEPHDRDVEAISALRALALVSRKGYNLYTPILYQDLILEPRRLHCFFETLRRIPEIGDFVRTLRFTSFHITSMSFPRLPDGTVDISLVFELSLNRAVVEGSKSLKPFDHLLFNDVKHPRLETDTLEFHKERCSIARATILERTPNLQHLDFIEDVSFPFCKRLGVRDSRPLIGLQSNLKEITVEKNRVQENHLFSASNAVWILGLPNLKRAALYVWVSKKDVKFFKDHKSVLGKGMSKVTNLSLSVELFERNNEVCPEVIRCITNTTMSLTALSLNANSSGHLSSEGLRNSTSSLTDFKLKGDFFPSFKVANLSSFSKVKVLSGDLTFVVLLARFAQKEIQPNKAMPPRIIKPEFLPPLLEIFRLTSNILNSGEEWQQYCRMKNPTVWERGFPEYDLTIALDLISLPTTFKEIVSYRSFNPKRSPESFSGPDQEDDYFEAARIQLKMFCDFKKIQFTLVDEVAYEDVA